MTSASWGIEAAMEGLGSARLRGLPSVNAVLSIAAASLLVERFGRAASTSAVRAAVGDARTALRAGRSSGWRRKTALACARYST